MLYLLTADLHLTDRSRDSSRWLIFDKMQSFIAKNKKKDDIQVIILGDALDLKDRHSGMLVNRLIERLRGLLIVGAKKVIVLRGNHDAAPRGVDVDYWSFLNAIPNIVYINEPWSENGFRFLPFVPNPREAWKDEKWEDYNVIFIHQPITGAVTNTGMKIEAPQMVTFPKNATVYAGDIHVPQTLGPVTYIGAPHPINYGDNYTCRFLVIDDDGKIVDKVILHPPAKLLLHIRHIDEIPRETINPGDQIHIRYTLDRERISEWPIEEDAIKHWAIDAGVELKLDVAIEGVSVISQEDDEVLELSPKSVLERFAESEELSAEVVEMGLELLQKVVK